jgi:hypothetical protein
VALKTWVARFVVDHGRVTEEGGRLRTFQRRRLDELDVDLHVLCEPQGIKGDELGTQALDAIGRLFLQDRLSLTGGLARALRNTHQTLLDWNRRSLPREQVSVGIAAAAVSGNVVYFAQTGDCLAFLMQHGALSRLEPADTSVAPLGGGEFEPALRRFELARGDMLVAAGPALGSVVDQPTLEGLLMRGSDEALPDLYLLTRDLPNFALFAVTCGEGDDDDTSGATTSSEPESEVEMPPPNEEPGALPRRPVLAALDLERALEPAMAPVETGGDTSRTSELVVPRPVDISRPVIRLRNDQALGRTDYARTTGPARGFRINLHDGKLVRFAVAAIVVLLIAAFVPGLVREGRSEKLGDLVVAAERQLAASGGVTDPGERRRLLDDARRLANEALRIDSDNPAATQVRDQAAAALRNLDAVVDLGPLAPVATLSRQVTGDISLEALTVASDTAYVLDTKGGRVLAVPVGGGQPATVYQDGETYSGTPAKKPLYFAWEGGERGGRLLILDSERKLFELRPGSLPSPLQLRRSNTWSSVAGIAAYDGNLYVLDPRGNQVHRYLPASSGFDSEPTAVLSGNRDLGSGLGIAVEGDIFVYLKDGQVRRFRSGAEIEFPLSGIDRAPKAATDLALIAGAEELYLADSGNKRVIVASRDGAYNRQYVSNSFTDIRAISVASGGAQLFVIAGDTLFAAALKPLAP